MDRNPEQLVNSFREEVDWLVTGVTISLLGVFLIIKLAFPDATQSTVKTVQSEMLTVIGPVFAVLMVLFVLFAVVIIFSPVGDIRLGGPDASPTYSYPAYFAMFFSAGIAAGIVFSGPSEALRYYNSPAPFSGASAQTAGAKSAAMSTTFFHWGFSAWSAYVTIAVPIAYYAYNKGAKLRVSTLLLPFIGKRNLDHPAARLVDVLAVFATIGGVGVSVGFIGQQFLSGIEHQWGVQTSVLDTFIVIAGVTVIFSVSVITGVKRGIRRMAGVNVLLFSVMTVVTLILGPTENILSNAGPAFVEYLVGFIPMSFAPVLGGESWYDSWTLFYWIWWFSWAPFAGLFLASISRGRTLRTMTVTGVFVSGTATLVWFAVVSNAGLHAQTSGALDLLGLEEMANVAGFELYSSLPFGELLVFLFFSMIVTWMVTSADTSTLIISILGSKPGVAPDTATRAFWALLQGGMGFGLIVVGGADSLQGAAIITGGPIGILMFVGMIGLIVQFARDRAEIREHRQPGGVFSSQSDSAEES